MISPNNKYKQTFKKGVLKIKVFKIMSLNQGKSNFFTVQIQAVESNSPKPPRAEVSCFLQSKHDLNKSQLVKAKEFKVMQNIK